MKLKLLYIRGEGMIFGLNYETVIAYLFIFIVVIILLTILIKPIKWLFKLLISSFIGAFALIIFNFIGGFFDFTIGINPGSILTVGLLGIPGFLLLIFLKLYLS